MKIIKHTFRIPKLTVSGDELIEDGFIEETYTFSLLHKGMGIFEELSGKPLMSYLTDIASDGDQMEAINKFLDKNFIPNLASASYVKIVDGKFHNNRATAEEFKKTAVFPRITEDLAFVEELVEMAVDCILGDQKALNNSKNKAGSGKK
jgi:hypothetical protein